jgi:hypothetical protein
MTRATSTAAEAETEAVTPAAPSDLAALLTPRRHESTAREIPGEVVTFVESAYEAWQADPRTWQVVTLSSGQAVEEIHRQARRYAAQRETALTFQRRRTDDPTQLVYRVRSKISQKRGSR